VRGYVPQTLIEWAELNTCSALIKTRVQKISRMKISRKKSIEEAAAIWILRWVYFHRCFKIPAAGG
jgi:hypothetical protein